MATARSWHGIAEALLLPLVALAAALMLFGLFVAFDGHSPVEVWSLLFLATEALRERLFQLSMPRPRLMPAAAGSKAGA